MNITHISDEDFEEMRIMETNNCLVLYTIWFILGYLAFKTDWDLT